MNFVPVALHFSYLPGVRCHVNQSKGQWWGLLVAPQLCTTGGRLFPRFTGRQARYFLLDPFGLEKSHPNLGVPPVHHLTAFPVPVSQHQTFLGVRVGARWDNSGDTPVNGGVLADIEARFVAAQWFYPGKCKSHPPRTQLNCALTHITASCRRLVAVCPLEELERAITVLRVIPALAPSPAIACTLCVALGTTLSSRSKALRGKPVMKRRQGVVYGTAAAWNQNSARTLISKLTGFVELHSTVAPQDAKFWWVLLLCGVQLKLPAWPCILRRLQKGLSRKATGKYSRIIFAVESISPLQNTAWWSTLVKADILGLDSIHEQLSHCLCSIDEVRRQNYESFGCVFNA